MQKLKALAAQLLGTGLTAWFIWQWPSLLQQGLWSLGLLQGLSAAICAILLRQPFWWLPIHCLFLPSALALLMLHLPAGYYLLVFLLLVLLFWGTFKGDVPLFLSSAAVVDTVMGLVEKEHPARFVELGAGIGSIVVPLAKQRPLMIATAYELAPLPWGILAWRSRKLANLKLYRTSFWDDDLGAYEVAFAFLSPEAMPKLRAKIKREMSPGSLFISSSFPLPAWKPESIKQIQDLRKTTLYCYRIP